MQSSHGITENHKNHWKSQKSFKTIKITQTHENLPKYNKSPEITKMYIYAEITKMPRKYMNSPKIQLLPQGFATRGAQGAKSAWNYRIQELRNAENTQKCKKYGKVIKL